MGFYLKRGSGGSPPSTDTSIQIDQSGGTSDTYGVLVGAVNGVNTDFTVSLGVYPTGKLTVFLNGQLQIQGTGEDWIELVPASGTFRFNTAPPTGSLITTEYGGTSVSSTVAWGNVSGTLSSQSDLNTALNNRVARTGDRGIVLAAGSTTPGTAPIKLTEQASPLATVEPGTIELVGHSFQVSKYLKRRAIATSSSVITASTTVQNTVAESLDLITAEHGANYLEPGMIEEISIKGVISQRNNAAAFGTFRVKYAGVTVQTLSTPASVAMTNVPFILNISFTCRTIGATGTARLDALMITGSSIALDPGAGSDIVMNTTITENTTVTFQWNEANVADIFSVHQGHVLCLDTNK